MTLRHKYFAQALEYYLNEKDITMSVEGVVLSNKKRNELYNEFLYIDNYNIARETFDRRSMLERLNPRDVYWFRHKCMTELRYNKANQYFLYDIHIVMLRHEDMLTHLSASDVLVQNVLRWICNTKLLALEASRMSSERVDFKDILSEQIAKKDKQKIPGERVTRMEIDELPTAPAQAQPQAEPQAAPDVDLLDLKEPAGVFAVPPLPGLIRGDIDPPEGDLMPPHDPRLAIMDRNDDGFHAAYIYAADFRDARVIDYIRSVRTSFQAWPLFQAAFDKGARLTRSELQRILEQSPNDYYILDKALRERGLYRDAMNLRYEDYEWVERGEIEIELPEQMEQDEMKMDEDEVGFLELLASDENMDAKLNVRAVLGLEDRILEGLRTVPEVEGEIEMQQTGAVDATVSEEDIRQGIIADIIKDKRSSIYRDYVRRNRDPEAAARVEFYINTMLSGLMRKKGNLGQLREELKVIRSAEAAIGILRKTKFISRARLREILPVSIFRNVDKYLIDNEYYVEYEGELEKTHRVILKPVLWKKVGISSMIQVRDHTIIDSVTSALTSELKEKLNKGELDKIVLVLKHIGTNRRDSIKRLLKDIFNHFIVLKGVFDVYVRGVARESGDVYSLLGLKALIDESDEFLGTSSLDSLIDTIISSDYLEFIIYKAVNKGRRVNNEFFPYINISRYDFSCLQIYKKFPDNYVDTCAIYSLKYLGYGETDEEKNCLNHVKVELLRHKRGIDNKDLKLLSEICNIRIELEYYDGKNWKKRIIDKGKSIQVNGFSETKYHILQCMGHYMPMVIFDMYSKSGMRNYNKIEAVDMSHIVYNVDNRKQECKVSDLSKVLKRYGANKQWKTVDDRANTKDVIHFLVKNKDIVLKEIEQGDHDIFSTYFNDDVYNDILPEADPRYYRPVLRKCYAKWERENADIERRLEERKQSRKSILHSKKILMKKNWRLDRNNKYYSIPDGVEPYDEILYGPYKFESSEQHRLEHLEKLTNKKLNIKKKPLQKGDIDGFQYQIDNWQFKNNVYATDREIIYLDIESAFYTEEEKLQYLHYEHVPYCCCYVGRDKDGNIYRRGFTGLDCIIQALNSLSGNYLIYIHNLKYDITFILKYLKDMEFDDGYNRWNSMNMIKSDGSVYTVRGWFCNTSDNTYCRLEFRDSYKMIVKGLKGFGKMFQLSQSKELCPYNLYTYKSVQEDTCDIKEAERLLREQGHGDDDIKQFNDNLIDKNFVDVEDESKFYHVEYGKYYCIKDCEVLMLGMEKFREWMYLVTLEDIFDSLTAPSVAHKYFIEMGAYEGCYQLSGVMRYFMSKAVVGGRVMCRDNTKQLVEGDEIYDFDAVSLYPSAMARLGGYCKGLPKLLKKDECKYNFIKNMDGYIVEIKIIRVKKRLHFPLISKHVDVMGDDNSKIFNKTTRTFGNFEGVKIIVDKISLEDFMQYHLIDFEIVRGYYWNEGRNDAIGNVIRILFSERKKKKAEKNPIQEVYKLLMNSAYGKTIQKAHEDELKIVKKSKRDFYLIENYNNVKSYQEIYDSDYMFVERYHSINLHFSMPYVGAEILAMSKRIMNEVICLAESLNINIYYQDTDSMHITRKGVDKLSEEYLFKFGRPLIGKNLGQFHNDFNSNLGDPLYSKKFIGLGKKCYCDVLEVKKSDGNMTTDYFFRMKGVSSASVIRAAKNMGITMEQLYMKLYEGEKIEFDLTKDCKFEFTKDMRVKTRQGFLRCICFPNKPVTDINDIHAGDMYM